MSLVEKYREKLYRALQVYLLHDTANIGALRDSGHPYGPALADVLSRLGTDLVPGEAAWVDRIETERARLKALDGPIVDGRLGEGSDYEKGLTYRKVCHASKAGKPALLMFHLVRTLNPVNIIELGTCVGISTAYQAAALALNNRGGRIATLEAAPYLLNIAGVIHSRLGLDNVTYVQGYFADTLLPTLNSIGPVDFAYIDGHHQYQPTLDYCDTVLAHAKETVAIVFDDIRWSDGMKRAWAEIRNDDRFSLVVDLHSMGICIRTREDVPERYISRELYAALK